jgi:hypothetical protein
VKNLYLLNVSFLIKRPPRNLSPRAPQLLRPPLRLNHFETRKAAMLATLLDPRIKKHGFRCQENASNANTELLHELNYLIRNEVQVSCDIAKEP